MGKNMKRTKTILLVLIFCLFIFSGNVSSFYNRNTNYTIFNHNNYQSKQEDTFDDFVFDPMDIQLRDDAYHGKRSFHSYEWWYFDATLDNGYCVQVSIRVINVLNRVAYAIGLNIYKDGEPISTLQDLYFKDRLFASTTEPLVILDGKEIMKGYIDESTGDWIYNLDYFDIRARQLGILISFHHRLIVESSNSDINKIQSSLLYPYKKRHGTNQSFQQALNNVPCHFLSCNPSFDCIPCE